MTQVAPGTNQPTPVRPERSTVVDLSAFDPNATAATREQMLEVIPHRDEMALLDRVVWSNADYTEGVASLTVRGDEFWVRGHFPQRPMMPGVLMVEAGAQLACWMYNKRQAIPCIAAFLRIEQAVFRQSVTVGDTMLVLCKESKFSSRRFCTDVQGIVNDQLCFEASIIGMRIGDA